MIKITEFYDMNTHSFTYVVQDESTRDAIVIDPVLDGAQKEFILASELNVRGILETHAHADHMTGSQELKKLFPKAPICIGKRITIVQELFKNPGQNFDHLFEDFETRVFGTISIKALPTQGHTPCCLSYLIEDSVFTGDSLFMPDFGTGRCDFPGGSAKALYHSISKVLYGLPDDTKVFVAHDYCPNGRDLAFMTTIGESKLKNKHITQSTTENDFVEFRESRDKSLEAPKDLSKNIFFNVNAGIPLP